jgi:hypothetical protein
LTFTAPTSGTITKSTVSGIDQLSYAQNALFKGADSFTYTVSDSQSSSTSNISFNVFNNAPSTKSYSEVLLFANSAAGITFNIVDPDAADSSNLSIQFVETTA